jgi:CHASE3 domain sensor protein
MKKEKNSRLKWDLVGQNNAEAGFNISWASIIAGVVTFLAFLITFSLIGSAIGFGQVEATTNNPLDGVGTGLLIWTVVAFVLSLAAAGFIAGVTSRRMGMIHGFLTWATSVIVFILMLSYVTSGIFSVAGTALGNIFSVAGKSVETVASGTGNLISKSFDQIVGSVGEVDSQELEGQVNSILQDTDVPELQPDYINNELQEASAEIMNAGKEIALNPDNTDQIIKETSESLQQRAQTLTDVADEEAIANAVNENTDLTQAEADEATDNIYNGLQEASSEAQQMLDQASQQINEAQQQLDQQLEQARVMADEAADATAKASIWGFVALLLGLILTSITGLLGSNFVADRNEERM